jgi:teichuronic acid biosynthesis glycosyltransferase TuaC
VANRAHFLYNIPYFVTWHGCDINNDPFVNRFTRIATVKVLKEAAKNFFVSRALFEASDKLAKEICKAVLYNGVSDEFTTYPVHRKELLKIKHNVQRKKVVAFVGGIVEEKNIFSLPGIFKNISSFRNVVFWIIGDGKYRKSLEKQCISMNLNVRFSGNQPPALIPELMNCIDVLILPSYREGLPLVVVEALACGCAVFGSRVGGIPEVIGIDNTFELNDHFENNLSEAVTEFLETGKMRNQTFDREKYSWRASAKSELAEINSVLRRDYLKTLSDFYSNSLQ